MFVMDSICPDKSSPNFYIHAEQQLDDSDYFKCFLPPKFHVLKLTTTGKSRTFHLQNYTGGKIFSTGYWLIGVV